MDLSQNYLQRTKNWGANKLVKMKDNLNKDNI